MILVLGMSGRPFGFQAPKTSPRHRQDIAKTPPRRLKTPILASRPRQDWSQDAPRPAQDRSKICPRPQKNLKTQWFLMILASRPMATRRAPSWPNTPQDGPKIPKITPRPPQGRVLGPNLAPGKVTKTTLGVPRPSKNLEKQMVFE